MPEKKIGRGPESSRRRLILCAVIAVVVVAGAVAIKFGRHYVLPRRFAVVVPGELYRSG